MKVRIPISEHAVRVLTFGALLSTACLYAAEKAAEHYETDLTFDPPDSDSSNSEAGVEHSSKKKKGSKKNFSS